MLCHLLVTLKRCSSAVTPTFVADNFVGTQSTSGDYEPIREHNATRR